MRGHTMSETWKHRNSSIGVFAAERARGGSFEGVRPVRDPHGYRWVALMFTIPAIAVVVAANWAHGMVKGGRR